jgi:Fe-S cluster biogenesis protein NfuA
MVTLAMNPTETDVKLSAHLQSQEGGVCTFRVDRPVLPGAYAYFQDKDQAHGSSLAEKLFAIGEVSSVRISGSDIVITRNGYGEWPPLAKQIGAAIREHLKSGAPAVADSAKTAYLPEEALKAKVAGVFETQINPAVAQHGGFVELLGAKENKVYLRMGGGCHGCGSANVTLTQGIETTLREQIPQILEVVDATDHASGTNPYFR